MEEYHVNRIHYLTAGSLKKMMTGKYAIYLENSPESEYGDVVFISIFFQRPYSNHPEITHRIDLWANRNVTAEQITAALLGAFEEEWQESQEHGFD